MEPRHYWCSVYTCRTHVSVFSELRPPRMPLREEVVLYQLFLPSFMEKSSIASVSSSSSQLSLNLYYFILWLLG